MAKFQDLVGRTVGVIIDAETAMADYVPSVSGRLKKITVIAGGIAATTLLENGYIKLACKTFGGVDHFTPFDGQGLYTAVPRAKNTVFISECDLAINAGVPVHVFYYHNVLPTTPEITVFGEIEA